MSQTILAKTAWHDGAFRADMILEIADGVLRAIRPTHAGETVDRTVRLAGPALTDLQVNGSGGVMLNSDPSAEAIATPNFEIVTRFRTLPVSSGRITWRKPRSVCPPPCA